MRPYSVILSSSEIATRQKLPRSHFKSNFLGQLLVEACANRLRSGLARYLHGNGVRVPRMSRYFLGLAESAA